MNANLDSIIRAECIKQHVGEDRMGFLRKGYDLAKVNVDAGVTLTLDLCLEYAVIIEPDNKGQVRSTEVTFANGGYAVPASNVRSALEALFDNVDVAVDDESTEYWVREFLTIHPFTDGNGRTAWLLLQILGNKCTTPVPLPYFFDEESRN